MVQLVLDHIWVELGQLVIHVSGAAIVLDVEVAVCEQGKSSPVPWAELQLISEDANDLRVFLVANERVDSLSVLAVRHRAELSLVHFVREVSNLNYKRAVCWLAWDDGGRLERFNLTYSH